MNTMQQYYEDVIRLDMIRKFQYANPYSIPKIDKIIVNMGVKEGAVDKKQILPPMLIAELVTGQKSVITKARKSVANFKIRKGFPIGVKVTLRGDLMYNFLYRLVTVVLPRVRDFKGVSHKNINNTGNFSFGIRDLLVFPEIEMEYDKLSRIYGAHITIVTSAKTKNETEALLSAFQIPFIH
uniref:Ribosomal protein L5 n=1 Tax=Histiona aroides TaxID=392300 RepID=M4QKQ8_HISAR|nr:ribosomal protein L5 [Histiona aroides]AGH24053.1 ribosomal protein L5 [Histiona aroides]